MRRYWIPKEQLQDQSHSSSHSNGHELIVRFSGDIFHHIFDVCRQGKGSKFEVLLGDQKAHLVEVTQIGKKSAEAKVLETRDIPPLKPPYIHLAMSIPRFPVMESVIERAVEMGVTTIHPFFSEFSFVRSSNSLPAAKLQRWQKIVISATQQSGRGDMMTIEPAISWSDIQTRFNQRTNKMGLFAYEGEGQQSVKEYCQSHRSRNPEEIWVFVGGEGGFSTAEVEQFRALSLAPVTLGEQVLRVETACIALVSVLKYEFDLMG
jgi:16S rRNA (uracil1498-N3)-methyltransferase